MINPISNNWNLKYYLKVVFKCCKLYHTLLLYHNAFCCDIPSNVNNVSHKYKNIKVKKVAMTNTVGPAINKKNDIDTNRNRNPRLGARPIFIYCNVVVVSFGDSDDTWSLWCS